jgi:hypothetical protein
LHYTNLNHQRVPCVGREKRGLDPKVVKTVVSGVRLACAQLLELQNAEDKTEKNKFSLSDKDLAAIVYQFAKSQTAIKQFAKAQKRNNNSATSVTPGRSYFSCGEVDMMCQRELDAYTEDNCVTHLRFVCFSFVAYLHCYPRTRCQFSWFWNF